jgi:hypothetical protein
MCVLVRALTARCRLLQGMASTIMVARVALLAADTTYPLTSVRVSALEFRARSTDPTVTVEVGEGARSVDGDKISASEGQADEEKSRWKPGTVHCNIFVYSLRYLISTSFDTVPSSLLHSIMERDP